MENNTLKDTQKQFSRIGMALFVGTLLIYAVQSLSLLFIILSPAVAKSGSLSFLASMLPVYLIAFPVTFLLFKRIPVQLHGEKKKMSLKQLLSAFLVAIACTYVFNFLGNMLTLIIAALKQSPVDNVLANLVGSINPAANFFVIVICAPILEELMFRKAIIDRTVGYGEGVSVLFSGLLFGLFHGNLIQFAYAFFLGLLFGFVYVKTKNILYSIILHMMVNFMGSFVSSLVLEWSGLAEEEAAVTGLSGSTVIYYVYALLLTVFVVSGIFTFFSNQKKFTFTKRETDLKKGQRFKTMFLNPGVLLFSIFWIVAIVMQLMQ